MAYFADLTPHTYSPCCGANVLNVGWLDDGKEFATGETSDEFKNALKVLCEHPIILHRGVHGCYFCFAMRFAKLIPSGNGQIRVLGKEEVWYSAPTLIFHYVLDHSYLPPREFIDAVVAPIAVGADFGWLNEYIRFLKEPEIP